MAKPFKRFFLLFALTHQVSFSPLCRCPHLAIAASASLALPAATQLFVHESGEHKEGVEATSSGLVEQGDLLIVGPGVLGRIVAEQWRKTAANALASMMMLDTMTVGYKFNQ